MKLKELFYFYNAKSKGFEDYQKGNIAFVTNGFRNNGIIGYVTPNKGDRVFNKRSICVSAFCEATVQYPPFLPRGNGGSGLIILDPIRPMSFDELLQICAYINNVHSWRFSYGRMVNKQRIEGLEIGNYTLPIPPNNIIKLLPKPSRLKTEAPRTTFKIFSITDYFDLDRGQFHALDKLIKGKYPTVSRVAYDNGIVGFYNKPKKAKIYPKATITVATTTGDAFVQLDDFISTDNVVILLPKQPMTLRILLFFAAMINKEKWRVSYGRQCYKTIFAKTKVYLPIINNGSLDIDYINRAVENAYNFKMVSSYLNLN